GYEQGKVAEERAHPAQQAPSRTQTFASLDALKNKYNSALQVAKQQGVQISGMALENGKLMIQGSAPSAEAAKRFNDEIVRINPNMDDIVVNLNVSEAQAPAASTEAQPKTSEGEVSREKPAAPVLSTHTYIVKNGDTLARISKHFYGNTNGAMRIF